MPVHLAAFAVEAGGPSRFGGSAMPALLDCPGTDEWDALFAGTVAPAQYECYARHLEACPACQ
jgi:hypothetical protein